MLLNITGDPSLALYEVNEAAEIIAQAADPEANIIFGAVIDDSLEDEIRITVIATGFDRVAQAPRAPVEEIQIRPFTAEDLEIPAFLRRRTR